MKRFFLALVLLGVVIGKYNVAFALTGFTTGGGQSACSDVVSCEIAMMSQVWGIAIPTDPAPPTVINVLTGTGGGFTNCVQGVSTSGCATGVGQWGINNTTISTANFNVSSNSLNMTQPVQGANHWNYAVIQNNGSVVAGDYTGCFALGTISSVSNATTFVANAPTTTNGTCGADMGANDTTATVVIWDGLDQPAFSNAISAASALATAYNTGAIVKVPPGIYPWYQRIGLSSNVTIQCDNPATTILLNPAVGIANEGTFWTPGAQNVTIENCTFAGTDTWPHFANSRQQGDWLQFFGGSMLNVIGNVFKWTWGNQGIVLSPGNPGAACTGGVGGTCPYGQACNTGGFCQTLTTDMTFVNNVVEFCEGNGFELGEAQNVHVVHNKFIDCDLKFEMGGGFTTDTARFMWGNVEVDNDIYCDATGNGLYVDTGDHFENGCSLTTANHNTNDDMSNSIQANNHIHSLNAQPAAYCWTTINGPGTNKQKINGNTCVAGEHCSNHAGC